MEIEFADPEMEKLAKDAKYIGKHSFAKIKKFRERITRIMQAMDRRDLYAQKSLRLEKLKGERKHQHSIRLNDQNRLIVEFIKKEHMEIAKVIAMEDYHK
jgi:proteic killer suppression protein